MANNGQVADTQPQNTELVTQSIETHPIESIIETLQHFLTTRKTTLADAVSILIVFIVCAAVAIGAVLHYFMSTPNGFPIIAAVFTLVGVCLTFIGSTIFSGPHSNRDKLKDAEWMIGKFKKATLVRKNKYKIFFSAIEDILNKFYK